MSESKYKIDWKKLIEKFNSLVDFNFRQEVETQLQEYIEKLSQNYREVWEKFSNHDVKSSIENVRKFFEKTKEGQRLKTISGAFIVALIGGLLTAIVLRFFLAQNVIVVGYSVVPTTGIYGIIFAFYFIGAYLAYHYLTTKTWRQSLRKNKELAMEKLNKELENIKAYITYLSEFSKKISSEAGQKISRIVKVGTKIEEEEKPVTENQDNVSKAEFEEV